MPFISALSMSKMKKIAYKYCIVPSCFNSTFKTPDKLFFWVPKDPTQRDEWCKAMKRDTLSIKSTLYCCEDHFSLEDDMQNYWQYKLTADVRKISLKKDVVPHIFSCQQNSLSVPEKLCAVKRKSKNDVKLNAEKIKCIPNSLNVKEEKIEEDGPVPENKIKFSPKAEQITIPTAAPFSNNNNVGLSTPEIEIIVKQEIDTVDDCTGVDLNFNSQNASSDKVSTIRAIDQKDLGKFANCVSIKQEKCEKVCIAENKINHIAKQNSPITTAAAAASSYNCSVDFCTPKIQINMKQKTDTVNDCADVYQNCNFQNATIDKMCDVPVVDQKDSCELSNCVNVKKKKGEKEVCTPENKINLPHSAVQDSPMKIVAAATSSNNNSVDFCTPEIEIKIKQETETVNDCAETNLNYKSTTNNVCALRPEVRKEHWKAEKGKNDREKGLEYFDRNGKVHRTKGAKYACKKTCRNKCISLITHEQQSKIHEQFWNLSASEKNNFYCKFIERETTSRTRTTGENMRRTLFSYTYYLSVNGNLIKVCQDFFLNTIEVSKRRIYYFFHEVLDKEAGTARLAVKGRNTKSNIDEKEKEAAHEQIKPFSQVESHHSRTETSKECTELDLPVAEMHQDYKSSVIEPVKESPYRYIFNSAFNVRLLKSSKEPYSISKQRNKTDLKLLSKEVKPYNQPIEDKNASKTHQDKYTLKGPDKNENICSICFYLENMFSLPKVEMSNYLYDRKLNANNSTKLCSYHGKTRL